jgi:endonuclease YncB( thermonuclease family)
MRSPKSLLIGLLIIALAAAIAQGVHEFRLPAPTAPRIGPPPAIGATVTGRAHVVDGDSLEVAGERVRLFGIDAPEGRQTCRDAAGRPYGCGHEARRALANEIAGRTVSCTPVEHDRYERSVALCSARGRDLGEAMVRSGYAFDLPQHSRGRYAAAEREARDARRGLWSGAFERPAEWRARNMR